MAASRPAVRTTTEFRLPSPYPDPAQVASVMAKAGADVAAQVTQQWMQLWVDSASRAAEAWWKAALPRP